MKEDKELQINIEELLPMKFWFSLKEACAVKNLNYKTSCNKTFLQPNMGSPDGRIGGKKMWNRNTVIEWLKLSDEEIRRNYYGKK